MGSFIEEIKVAFAKSKNIGFDLDKMFDRLLSADFPEDSNLNTQISNIQSTDNSELSNNLVNIYNVKSFIKHSFDFNTKEYAELMACFPETEFMYLFFQITEYKWIKRFRNILVKKVKTNIKFQVNSSIFEDNFVKESMFGFNWRVLKHPGSLPISHIDLFKSNLSFDPIQKNSGFQIRFLAREWIDLEICIKNQGLQAQIHKPAFKKVIIHIHGGGFISMPSSSHQSYLTKFVRKSEAVLFTIDYPLAPQNKFLAIIDCIFKAYLTIIVLL